MRVNKMSANSDYHALLEWLMVWLKTTRRQRPSLKTKGVAVKCFFTAYRLRKPNMACRRGKTYKSYITWTASQELSYPIQLAILNWSNEKTLYNYP